MRRWLTLMLLIVATAAVFGGDLATFQNLGFSPDGRTFAFGQYGVAGDASSPFAEIYVVDVAGNRFVSNGTFSLTSTAPLELGQDGRGALYNLLADAQSVFSRQSVDHLQTGRPIYILVDGETPPERLAFRDFVTETRYEITLDQTSRAAGESMEAAFSITLRLTRGDRVQTYEIGRPSLFRQDVEAYRITQVLVGPENGSVVLVVEKRSPDGSVRYMVETASLN